MAGRGRGGGGGGGGRGRGRGMTFDARDLGFAAGETLPAPVLQPPPLFPPQEHQPAPMTTNAEMVYMVALKKDLVVFLKDHLALNENGELMKDMDSQLDWAIIPDELKTAKRRAEEKKPRVLKKANFDINSLDALGKLEENMEEPEEEKEEDEKRNEENENEDETEEDVDEEMDDGTDYVCNYFDNGELDDDDDTGNDGPIY